MELHVTKMSGLGLMKCSSMEECSPKESYFIKKNHSTNDVPGMNLNRNLKGNFNKTTYQPYIPSYPKINNLHISSPSNGSGFGGSGGGRDLSRLDLGKTLNNLEFSPWQPFLGNSLDHNYSDKYGNNNPKGSYKDSVHATSNGVDNGANGGPNCGTYRDNSAGEPASGESRTPKPSKSESEHVCLSGKDLEEFRTRQCPLYAKGMCLNSSKCSLSHSETWPRRNPVLFKYDYKLCPNIQFSRHDNKMQLHGKCSFGRRCRFSHSKEEQLYHPELYKTRYCLNFPNCKGYYCPFAHSKEELRNFQPSSNQNAANNRLDGGSRNSSSNDNTSNNYTNSANANNGLNSSVNSGSAGLAISGDFNANVGSPSNGNVNAMRVKQRPQRDNGGTAKGKNDLGITAYNMTEEENSPFNYKNRNEDVLNTTINPDGSRGDNSLKFREEWTSNYRAKEDWNSGLKGKNDDVLSNTTSAYSTYNVEELDIDLSSTYDTLSYHNHNASEAQKNYNNHKLFKEVDRQLNHGAEDDNQRSPRSASDNLYSLSANVERDDPGLDKQDEEEDYNWFESLIKNGLHSLEDNPKPGIKSWMGDEDLHEVFNNLRDCSIDNNCPFCSDKREYKFTDSEKMVKLSEDLFKPWSAA
ncbi:hypothetical protein MACJ_001607 [Theileria orientalis]|uniref:C3H1-type domain-containing protein n=1 Tax=Theileria orientalis TaxID=68886 RepID=A0A976M8P2_THEOR|nr:hypothetical protein MACJ_001607 [Theileria orientalis]